MEFLRNAWYVAAGTEEVSRTLMRRVLLGEPVVFYRRLDGSAVALQDRCAHRFAPLSRGTLQGDWLRCSYHGLSYDSSGRCVHNPHGDGCIARRARTHAYPLLERYGFVWIWMGEPALADPALLPGLAPFDTAQGRVRQGGYLQVQAHYQLIIDNLLDLSHVEYLHAAFASAGSLENTRHEVFERDGAVHSNRWKSGCGISPLLSRCWGRENAFGDARSCIRWHAPGTLYLEIGATEAGAPTAAGVALPILHLLTPAETNATHYFWAVTRDCRTEDAELSAWIGRTLHDAFVNEDEPMIEAQQAQIGEGVDIMSLRPLFLAPDAAPLAARKLLAQRIAAESGRSVAAVSATARLPQPVASGA